MWGNHYETLLNCIKLDEYKGKSIDFLRADNHITKVCIQPCQVKEASPNWVKLVAVIDRLQSISYLVRQPKGEFFSNLAVKVPQWVLIDLI